VGLGVKSLIATIQGNSHRFAGGVGPSQVVVVAPNTAKNWGNMGIFDDTGPESEDLWTLSRKDWEDSLARPPMTNENEPEAGRPRMFVRQAQEKLTLRRTIKYAPGPSPCGCPAHDASACAARGTTISTTSRRRLVHNAG
jgi:hypothetical protein